MSAPLLRNLPSVQEILLSFSDAAERIDSRYLTPIVQKTLVQFREEILAGKYKGDASREELKAVILKRIQKTLQKLLAPRLRRIINATGIILHTNMGRAPLPPTALEKLPEILTHFCNLEMDVDSGKRGRRDTLVEDLLCLLTGAEAAVVVNNNAAAVLLAVHALANRKEVPVSMGELVEIGGSFRMPEVIRAGGAKMVAIGTTNKTHLADYRRAISPKTGALLKVHTSNYRVLGFTQSVELKELVQLAEEHGLPLIYDMGSGVLEDLQNWGYPHEPVAREILETGVDVVTFSGDKVLGGPQAGIIVGKEKWISKIPKDHLLRALRCDKLTYALLESTLKLYLQPEELPEKSPVAGMLTTPMETLKERAAEIVAAVNNEDLKMQIAETYSQMGSGALPLEKIPSVAVVITSRRLKPDRIAKRMRSMDLPVIGYVNEDRYWLNLRTVREDEIPHLISSLNRLSD
ncbi:MAG: L-seryl-tRNA(Sec) selenium transferase [Calditrichia bacterium]